MANSAECPKCERTLPFGAKGCRCGWKAKAEKNISHQCAYSDSGQQCPLTGTITDSVKAGDETKFYCRYHVGWYDNPRAASQNLAAILSGELTLRPSCWDEDIAKKTKELSKTNSELVFKPEYGSQDYAEVCLAFMRRASKSCELPYNKQKSLLNTREEILTGHEITQEQIDSADISKYESSKQTNAA